MIITDEMVERFGLGWASVPGSKPGDRTREGLARVWPLIVAQVETSRWSEPMEFSVDPIDTWHRALQLAQGETGGGDLGLEDLRARAIDMLAVLLDPPVIDDV